MAATDPATCDAAELRSLAAGRPPVAVLARRGRRSGGRPLGRAGVGRWSPVVARGRRDRRTIRGVCGDARSPRGVGGRDPVSRSRRRDRPSGNRLDAEERVELAAQAPSLVEQAATTSVDVFARKVRDLARRISRDEGLRHHEKLRSQRTVKRWMDREGMCHTQISLDPEADARLSAAFDAAVAAEKAKPDNGRSFDQLKADAFMTMVTSTPVPGARHHAELLILIDLETAPHRPSRGQHLRDVRRPAPPTSNRAAPGLRSDIIPIVLDGDGRVVDVGRAKRLATADQRRALRAMHQTCAAPDCPVRFGDCDIHHLKEWNEGGADQPRQPDPTLLQAPPPHPRRPMAPTSESTRRIEPAAGPARPQAARRPDPSTDPAHPHLQELFDNQDAAATRTSRLCVTAQVPGDVCGDTERGAGGGPARRDGPTRQPTKPTPSFKSSSTTPTTTTALRAGGG